MFTQELLQFVQRRNGPGGRDAFWLLAIVRIQPAGRKPGVDATENIGLGSVATIRRVNGQDCPPVPAHNRKFSYSV